MTRTPTPWVQHPVNRKDVCHASVGHVATFEEVEDAADVVKAMSAHDKLVEALRWIADNTNEGSVNLYACDALAAAGEPVRQTD